MPVIRLNNSQIISNGESTEKTNAETIKVSKVNVQQEHVEVVNFGNSRKVLDYGVFIYPHI